jgi:DNA polymerase
MTLVEKNVLAGFLDIAAAYLRSGYAPATAAVSVQADPAIDSWAVAAEQDGSMEARIPLPLAYEIGEDEGGDSIEAIALDIEACAGCALGSLRNHAVPGEGVNSPLVMVIGEGPGADEDASGRPFVGKAGQLLDKMLASIGLNREKNCYIANTVKCRPPNNREPEPAEIEACSAFLDRQIQLLKPLLILCAGKTAARRILRSDETISRLRGHFSEYGNIPVLVTYHPSALLQNESYKRPAWEDLKMLREKLISLSRNYAAGMENT